MQKNVFLCVLICGRVASSLCKNEEPSGVLKQREITQMCLRNTVDKCKFTVERQYEAKLCLGGRTLAKEI